MTIMKKYFVGLSLVLLALSSCKKIDDSSVFDKSLDQRLNEKMGGYQSTLVGAPNGWKAVIYTQAGILYSFYFKFTDSNRVQMLANIDSTSAVTLRESSWRLKALQQPSLLFDTYNYIHVIADPDSRVSGGTQGSGQRSDFEFYFDDRNSTPDMMMLVGRFNGSRMEMRKASAQEEAGYVSGQMAGALQLSKIFTYYKRLVINGTDSIDININTARRVFAAVDDSGNLLDTARRARYSAIVGGIALEKPLKVGSKSVMEIKDFQFNQATNRINMTINGEPAVLKPVGVPAKYDTSAARRWRQYAVLNGDFWYSTYGWYNNGVRDALGLTTQIPGYRWVLYAPKEIAYRGWVNGDLAGVDFTGGSSLRTTSLNHTITNGIIKFTNQTPSVGLGATLPPNLLNLITGTTNSFRAFMQDPNGYYLVQTGPEAYDMVHATDGLKWINWIW